MGLGVSLILIAVGAILAFAVHVHNSSSFDVNTIGIILLVVGLILNFVPIGGNRRRVF